MKDFITRYQSLIPVVQKIILRRAGDVDRNADITDVTQEPLTERLQVSGRTDPTAFNNFTGDAYIDTASAYAESDAVSLHLRKANEKYKQATQSLRNGLFKLRRRINKYKSLLSLADGTTDIIFEDFINGESREPKRQFYSNKPALDADVDTETEALTLPVLGNVSRVRSARKGNVIARIDIDDKLGTYLSYLSNDTQHEPIKAIDNDPYSFWSETVLADEPIRIRPTWWKIPRVIVRVHAGGTSPMPPFGNLHDTLDIAVGMDPITPSGIGNRVLFYGMVADDATPTWVTFLEDAILSAVTTDRYGTQWIDLNQVSQATSGLLRVMSMEVLDNGDEFFPITHGAACKLHIMLQFPQPINQISLKPFSFHPLELVALYTIPNDNEDIAEDKGTVNYIFVANENTSPIPLKDRHIIQFDRVTAKRIYMILNQKSYVRNVYHVPRFQVDNTSMWNEIARQESAFGTELSEELTFEEGNSTTLSLAKRRNQSLDQRRVDEISGWTLFLEYAKRVKDKLLDKVNRVRPDDPTNSILSTMASILASRNIRVAPETLLMARGDDENELVRVDKLEYTYGLYDVNVREMTYALSGWYVSKPFTTKRDVAEFALKWEPETAEFGTVSAWVSYKDNDTSPQWQSTTNGTVIQLPWPANDDLVPITYETTGGHGKSITPTSRIYIHPCMVRGRRAVDGIFNTAKGKIGSNRMFEPREEDLLIAVSPSIWEYPPVTSPIDANANQELMDASQGSEKNMPRILSGTSIVQTGITETAPTAILETDRIYYQPVSVTVRSGNHAYLPDPFGELYFIEDYAENITNTMVLKDTLSGEILDAEIQVMGAEWHVRINTPSGEERVVPLWEIAFYASDTDLGNRIQKWDDTVNYDVAPVEAGVTLLGVKFWTDGDGNRIEPPANPTVNNVDLTDTGQVEQLFPLAVGQRSKVNIKFEEGLVTMLEGYRDTADNRKPYVGIVATKLRHIIPFQPRYPLGIITKNVTDYKSGRRPRLKRWDLDVNSPSYYPVIEYYHDVRSNRIEFAKQTPVDWEIKVDYAGYAPDIRVRFKLAGDSSGATPLIENYRIEVKEL